MHSDCNPLHEPSPNRPPPTPSPVEGSPLLYLRPLYSRPLYLWPSTYGPSTYCPAALTSPTPPPQVTTRVNSASNTSALAPALGESWGHACNVQLMLQWAEGEREARLYKGGAPGAARFQARRAPGANRTRRTRVITKNLCNFPNV